MTTPPPEGSTPPPPEGFDADAIVRGLRVGGFLRDGVHPHDVRDVIRNGIAAGRAPAPQAPVESAPTPTAPPEGKCAHCPGDEVKGHWSDCPVAMRPRATPEGIDDALVKALAECRDALWDEAAPFDGIASCAAADPLHVPDYVRDRVATLRAALTKANQERDEARTKLEGCRNQNFIYHQERDEAAASASRRARTIADAVEEIVRHDNLTGTLAEYIAKLRGERDDAQLLVEIVRTDANTWQAERDEALATAAKLREGLTWIACSERMPEKDDRYLVVRVFSDGQERDVSFYYASDRTWQTPGRVSHWAPLLPLPTPPPSPEATSADQRPEEQGPT